MMNRRNILTIGAGIVPVAAATKPVLAAARFGIKPNLARDQSKALQKAIDSAAKSGGELHLPGGIYIARKLKISSGVTLSGVDGLTRIVLSGSSDFLLHIENAKNVTLRGLRLDGGGRKLSGGENAGIVSAANTQNLLLEHCRVENSTENGIVLDNCSGKIVHCQVLKCRTGGIFSLDGKGLEIGQNDISKIGDNGIMVWQSKKREDGTIVHHNQIRQIFGKSGGNGQYGNAIGVYRAGNVTINNNRITDCNFSAVRNNGGENIVICDNNCSRMNEVAIFVEFGFQGAVVSGNIIEQSGMGISITNFNEGGRLAVCANNVVRNMLGARSNPDTQAIGIAVEADTSVSGNVVENAKRCGIWLGWGKYMRDVSATGNIIRNCSIGVSFSAVKGAKSALISNNLISGSVQAIAGMDHDKVITKDFSEHPASVPSGFLINNNLTT